MRRMVSWLCIALIFTIPWENIVELPALAYETFNDRPVLGVGSGAFRGADSRHVPHNFVLGFLVELGIVGFLLFATILLLAAASVRGQPPALARLWATTPVTWLIGASLYNFGEKKQTWLFFSLLVAGAGLLETARHPDTQAATRRQAGLLPPAEAAGRS